MSIGEYLGGLVFFSGTTGAVALAAILLLQRRYPYLRGASRVLAWGILATSGLIAVHLLPGVFGVLSRWTVLAVALAYVLATWRFVPPLADSVPARRTRGASAPAASWATAGVAAAITAIFTIAVAWQVSVLPVTGSIDTLGFHLPTIARWIQSGSVWHVEELTPLIAHGTYPQNGNVVFLAAVLPWRNDAFVRLLEFPFAALTVIAIYAIALELKASRPAALLFALVFSALPIFVGVAYQGTMVDPVLVAMLGAGLYFLVRHFRIRRPGELVLAGLGLGIAFGTRWWGVASVVAIVAVWLTASLVSRRPRRHVLRQALALASVIVAAGGFWLARNLSQTGNPFFPAKIELVGLTLFDAPRDIVRERASFTIAHYLDQPAVWRDWFLPAFERFLGPPGLILLAGTLLGGALLAHSWRRRRTVPAAQAVALGGVVLLALVYCFTPDSAFGLPDRPHGDGHNTRYVEPALLLGAAFTAWVATQLGRMRLLLELLGLAAVVEGIRRSVDLMPTAPSVALLAITAAAVSATIVVSFGVYRRASRLRAGERRIVAIGIAASIVLVGAGAGYGRQREFNAGRYKGDPVLDWIATEAPGGHKIGLVAYVDPSWPFFGPRLENEVEYVGEFVDGQLRWFDHRADWVNAIRRRGYDLLVLSLDHPLRSGAIERRWLRGENVEIVAHTNALPLASSTRRLVLYRVPRRAPLARAGAH